MGWEGDFRKIKSSMAGFMIGMFGGGEDPLNCQNRYIVGFWENIVAIAKNSLEFCILKLSHASIFISFPQMGELNLFVNFIS